MRAKTINEIQHFERGLDPKKSMNIGISSVMKFLKWVSDDPQLEPTDDNYCGFVDVSDDEIYNLDLSNGYIRFVETWPIYKYKMEEFGLRLETEPPTFENTIFRKD